MTEDLSSELLTPQEVAWLADVDGELPPGSPLASFAGLGDAPEAQSPADRGLYGEPWERAFAVLRQPRARIRVTIPGVTETLVQYFFGGGVASDGLVGCWLEGNGLRVSLPWSDRDVVSLVSQVLFSTPPDTVEVGSMVLTADGLVALGAAVDALRSQYFSAMAERSEAQYRLDREVLADQAAAGSESTDARWILPMLRLTGFVSPATDVAIDRGIDELVDSGLLVVGEDDWRPGPTLLTLSAWWRDLLPVVSYETTRFDNGRVLHHEHRIIIRGQGPLCVLHRTGGPAAGMPISVGTVAPLEYFDEMTRALHRVTSGESDFVYVLEPVEVRDLGATDAVAGYLQPGRWYLVGGEAGAWARIEDPNGPLEGWAPVAALYRRVEVPDDLPATEPAAEQREVVWLATHVVPAAGLTSWAVPDGSTQPVADLSPEVELQVTELRSDWAHVRAVNGWEAWVDARQLLPVDGGTPGSPDPPVSAATDTPTLETTVEAPAWIADHAVPAEGLRAWTKPDPAGDAIANLAGGVELQVIERRADWANVEAENGWEAWVDGRRLVPILASGTASPATPVPVSEDSTLENVGTRTLAAARTNPVPLIAAIALLVSVFLPWFGGGAPWSFGLPAGFLWSFSADTRWFSIGLVMLIVGAVALASILVDQIAPYRRIVGGVAAAIAALWLIQTFRALLDFTDSRLAGIVADMFTDYFALGPWVALAAGVALLARR